MTHVHGWELAKTTILKLDGEYAMAVVPAPYIIDFERIRVASGARKVELATESEFRGLFPECECGAMPPFGNLYGLRVYIDSSLIDTEQIVFNAGSHTDAIRMGLADFVRLVRPQVASFGVLSHSRPKPPHRPLWHLPI